MKMAQAHRRKDFGLQQEGDEMVHSDLGRFGPTVRMEPGQRDPGKAMDKATAKIASGCPNTPSMKSF
jgi:hypothetical protein